MIVNRKINPDRLRSLLDRCPLSQKELAGKIETNVVTLSRWKTGKIRNIRSDKLARLCEALGTTPTELCADGPLPNVTAADDTARQDQVTMMLDTACRNALALVARRYGVTRQQIVEIAPLLFTIMAEQSLTERRKWLNTYSDVPLHLRRLLRAPFDEDGQEAWDAERHSINERDLFAVSVKGWNENHHKDNPFARFLSERLSETHLRKGKAVTWDKDEAPRYMIGIDELVDLLGKDKDACYLVLKGKVALAEMPRDIRKATPEARASWVKEKADMDDRAALVALEEEGLPDIVQLLEAVNMTTEDNEYDF